MTGSLALIAAGLAVLVVGLLVRNGRRTESARRQLLRRLDDGERSARDIIGQLKGQARSPYWSCQSVTNGRGLAASLVSQARTAMNQSRALAEQGSLQDADAYAAKAQALLGQAEVLHRYVESQVMPLIDRMRQGVQTLHGEASQTRALLHRWLSRRPRSAALANAEGRVAKLANALKAHELALISAPVTTLRSLNIQYQVMNEALQEIIADEYGDDRPPREGP